MSLGWSVGDIIAGLKVVWNIYESLSDGPLNAQLEAVQFFDEFNQIAQCLDRWEVQSSPGPHITIKNFHDQLRAQCQNFVKKHMRLIQSANPKTVTIREGRSTWLKNVKFSREQVKVLYQRVEWPLERKEVSRLRKKLVMYLQISTHNAVLDTNEKVKDMRHLQESNLRLVASHLEVVSSIAHNLKMITAPHEVGSLDYSLIRQFENAILPPPPMRAIEAGPVQTPLRIQFGGANQADEEPYACISESSSSSQDTGLLGQDETWIRKRLENIAKRGMNGGRPGDLVPSAGSGETRYSVVEPVLQRLRDLRNGFGDAVGVHVQANVDDHLSATLADAQSAFQHELGMWHQLEERIQYDVKRREQLLNMAPPKQVKPIPPIIRKPVPLPGIPPTPSPSTTSPIPIPISSPRISPNVSPMSSPPLGLSPSPSEGWFGSPDSHRSMHARSSSTSSSSGANSIHLIQTIPVILQHQKVAVPGYVKSIAKEDGEIIQITTVSQDGSCELRHSVDRGPTAAKETSMKPFLDNSHVDTKHKYRIQFQGSHIVKGTKRDSQGSHKFGGRSPSNPIYKFSNEKDFLDFQSMLLNNKEITFCADVQLIRAAQEPQCRLGTIRILLDPLYKTRSILYFRSKTKDSPHPAFVEWSTSVFKKPREPGSRCNSLTLDSSDGRSLTHSRGALSRRSTQGSATTIASFESATTAHNRLQERAGGSSIRSLVVEFYEASDCHDFWREFIKTDDPFARLERPDIPP